jgi:hypothetical protein
MAVNYFVDSITLNDSCGGSYDYLLKILPGLQPGAKNRHLDFAN